MAPAAKTVVITGAGHGIGRATARRFAAEGAQLVLGDYNDETLAEAAAEGASSGATVLPVPFDQRSSTSATALIDAAIERFGRIDVLATVAGIYPFAGAAETTDELWADVLATNLTGVFYCCRAALPAMVAVEAGASSPSRRERPRSPTPAWPPTRPARAASRPSAGCWPRRGRRACGSTWSPPGPP